MPVRDDGTCFACGKRNPDGLQLDIRPTPEGVELTYVQPRRYQGYRDMVHGGIVATLLDELCAWACSANGSQAVTGELSVRYRKPLPVGRPVRGFGRITRERGPLMLAESRLVDESGETVAEASAKMMKV